jgi:hypothetical protein
MMSASPHKPDRAVQNVQLILAAAKRVKTDEKKAPVADRWERGDFNDTPYFQAALAEYRRLHGSEG